MDSSPRDQALAAAEQALEALGRGDPVSARMAIAAATGGDQRGMLGRLADAVYLAASRLEHGDDIDEATWNQLADAVGEGSLEDVVEQVRS